MDSNKDWYAIWLLPNVEDFQKYSSIIGDLADEFQAPYFEPHVTIAHGIFDYDACLEAVQVVSKEVSAFAAYAGPTKQTDFLFKSLFIEFAADPFKDARSVFTRCVANEEYRFSPHLSLLYRQVSEQTRVGLCRSRNFCGELIRFDRIGIQTSGHRGDVTSWELVGVQQLAE